MATKTVLVYTGNNTQQETCGADNKSCLLQMIGSCVVRCFCWFKDFSSIKDIYKTCGVDICVLIKSINRRKSPNVFLPANTNPSA